MAWFRVLAWTALLLACAGCASLLSQEASVAAVPVLNADSLITRHGTSLPVERWRVPPGARLRGAIAALHSFGDYGRAFERLGPRLAEAGYEVVAIDQRGFGRNLEPGRWPGTDALVADALDLTQALIAETSAPVWLLGESMGGAVAVASASGNHGGGIAGMILAAPALREGIPYRYGWNVILAGLATFVPWYRPSIIHVDDRLVPEAQARLGHAPEVQRSTRLDTYYGLIRLADAASDAAGDVTVPTLLLYGSADSSVRPVSICAFARQVPGPLTARVYPGGLHRILHQARLEPELLAAITAFLGGGPVPAGSGIDAETWCDAPSVTASAPDGRASR